MLLLLTFTALAQVDLYLYDSLVLQLEVKGELNLIAKGSGASVNQVSAELSLVPKNTNRQQVLLNSVTPRQNIIKYSWDDGELGKKNFQYIAKIQTNNHREAIRTKMPFPVTDTTGVEEYLAETKTIDSHHPKIIAKAADLAEGEDDLFKVVFKLASWVEENVNYDLNTLTEKASQKASWVLENRQGVCDEMTSLFIAMARSLGIPARFVKGISYSNSPLFSYPWQPHGWAEVYFPGVGWVSFDVTFGEYGYIDVTHIHLRDSFDPQDPDSAYQWTANNVELQAQPLNLEVLVKDRGQLLAEEIELQYELFSPEVGFGSHNLVKGILTNRANYYAATTLQLATPPEVSVIGRNKRTILLEPNQIRETFWIIKIPEDLDPNYIYTFPALIYSEKNVTFRNKFTAQPDKLSYSREEIEKLIIVDEEKSYSRQVMFICRGSEQLKLGEKTKITCQIKNSGNANLAGVKFCLEKDCEIIDLPINQIREKSQTITAANPGWNKIFVSAENEFIEKKSGFNYAVFDQPKVNISFDYPEILTFADAGKMIALINKDSFSSPQLVEVKLTGPGIKSSWQTPELRQQEKISLDLRQARLGFKNKFKVQITWRDSNQQKYSRQEMVIIPGKAQNYKEKIKMIFNSMINWF